MTRRVADRREASLAERVDIFGRGGDDTRGRWLAAGDAYVLEGVQGAASSETDGKGKQPTPSTLWSLAACSPTNGGTEAEAQRDGAEPPAPAPQQPSDASGSRQQGQPQSPGQPGESASGGGDGNDKPATPVSSSGTSDDGGGKSKKPASVVESWGVDITGVVLSLLTTALAVTISLQWNDAVKHLLATSPWAKKMNRFVVALILTIIGVIITVIFAAIARAVGTTLPSSALSIPARAS